MRAASVAGARFVLVSSSSVYGDASLLPTPEHAPPAPLNPYAASKVAAEDVVREHGTDAVIVRPFSVYGPGSGRRWRSRAGSTVSGNRRPLPWHAAPGTARDFTYVDDVVAGILAALQRRPSGRGVQRLGLALRGPSRSA